MLNVNKTALIVTGMCCLTILISVFLFTSNKEASVKASIEQLSDTLSKEYGAPVRIDLAIHGATRLESERISEDFANSLNLEAELKEYEGSEWYDVSNAEKDVSLSVFISE